ncbi:hypothetical protein FRC20_007153 [Serendipita sp. 405]|nr:hypothetical protein FRC20_007153 [Serendipita sp. 405]
MKFVALVSGGKDSCFNISHCQLNGHELIAAASLRPKEGIDELDSYLYQTVGQDAIEYVGRALDVPLYRRVITGTAVELSNEYGTRNGTESKDDQAIRGDETEDLFELLQEVKRSHPEVEGVSVGAILSTYQRVRVEHVCRRLGLTALSYLWQRDQADLLQEMIDANVNAILIKVAGIGLKKQHLGKSLASMQPILHTLNERFGSHVCGEGGEYETLTLDCPAFKRRIVLTETESVVQDDKDFATVAYLRIKSAILEDKGADSSLIIITPPPILDHFGSTLYQVPPISSLSTNIQMAKYESTELLDRPLCTRRGNWVAIGNIKSPSLTNLSLKEEALQCFQKIKDLLGSENLGQTDIVHVTALLRTMDDFMPFNQVYSTMFGTSPPARACVAVALPAPCRITLECFAYDTSKKDTRSALHVQGISYWAPANIGPYSQAISVDKTTFISGQIGLVPSAMSLPTPRDFRKEMVLSLQHINRITEALQHRNPTPQGFVVWLVDIQDLLSAAGIMVKAIESNKGASNEFSSPPVLFVVPEALPKGALVEVQTLLHFTTEEETTDLDQDGTSNDSKGNKTSISLNITYFRDVEEVNSLQRQELEQATSLKVFYATTMQREDITLIEKLSTKVAVTLIPVKAIYSLSNGTSLSSSWSFAIVSTCG